MSEHESSHKHGDVTSEPGGADEVAAAHGSGDGLEGTSDEGVGLGAGAPSTFEPEEDPETVPEDPA
ncbi:hypothetical protein ICW40_18920 [Actinotalea ferrariae]|uniref:hypothetical protein n=1 Tax=Actinotalea ferrariae TaxID=1386098 RepID=UPI001C8C1D71|nr:hypothetical protein [Actinotalea ferrariae]MBX9246867.1 hypothetical protein [Actinotalea ferrariae]